MPHTDSSLIVSGGRQERKDMGAVPPALVDAQALREYDAERTQVTCVLVLSVAGVASAVAWGPSRTSPSSGGKPPSCSCVSP